MSLMKFPTGVDFLIPGSVTIQTALNVPAGTFSDAQINAIAGIQATKLIHDHLRGLNQPNSAATSETPSIHIARASGSVVEIAAGSIAIAVGAATVTIDLKKNGTSILSAVITLDTGNVARVVELGTLTGGATYVAGDWFELVVVATAGGGTLPTGLQVQVLFREVGAP